MKRIISGFFIVLILASVTGCGIFAKETTGKSTTARTGTNQVKVSKANIQLFFPNSDNSALPDESREINVYDGAIINAALQELIKGPARTGLRHSFPEGTQVLGVNLKDGTATVDFSREFTKTAGLAEILARASVVNTLTGITGVNKVRILIEGEDLIGPSGFPIGEMKRFSLDRNGYPIPEVSITVTLYFGSQDAIRVAGEKRQITIVNGSPIHKAVLEELIKGPVDGSNFYAFMPAGTKILSVKTDGDICLVDLSKEFVNNANTGTAGEAIIINSIVNSLTEIEGTKRVQFLIEGQKREVYLHAAFDEPFIRNESIIKK